MNITVCKKYDTKNAVELEFFDEDTQQEIGHAVYGIESSWTSRNGKDIQIKKGKIYDVIIDDKYQKKGILRQTLPGILCDLKCKGAEDIIMLHDLSGGAWRKLGFKKIKDSNDSYIDIKKFECDCMSKVTKIVKDNYDKIVSGEKDCCV